MEHAAVREVDELVLAPTPDASDERTGHRATLGRSDASAQRRMVNLERGDATADNERTEGNDGSLDFR